MQEQVARKELTSHLIRNRKRNIYLLDSPLRGSMQGTLRSQGKGNGHLHYIDRQLEQFQDSAMIPKERRIKPLTN